MRSRGIINCQPGVFASLRLRHLVADFHNGEAQHADGLRHAAAKRRAERARELIDAHVFDEGLRQMMHHACEAAESGQKEFMLLRFPNQLCIDGGRECGGA